MRDGEALGTQREPADLNALLISMRGRHSSNLIDKVCAIAFPFQKHGSFNIHNVTLPIYDPNTPPSVAWERLISTIASAKMESDVVRRNNDIQRTTTIQLLCLFPHPSRHHWFPSWTQVLQYPDRDNDPIPVSGDMDYSLRIVSGRIYRGCSLKLHQSPTSEREASYHCSMGMNSEISELVATVPGIELNIDSSSWYVLADISPDHSLGPSKEVGHYHMDLVGHVHPPLRRKSVIIVCKEVDVEVITSSPAILRYSLRRITTLEWDCGDLAR